MIIRACFLSRMREKAVKNGAVVLLLLLNVEMWKDVSSVGVCCCCC